LEFTLKLVSRKCVVIFFTSLVATGLSILLLQPSAADWRNVLQVEGEAIIKVYKRGENASLIGEYPINCSFSVLGPHESCAAIRGLEGKLLKATVIKHFIRETYLPLEIWTTDLPQVSVFSRPVLDWERQWLKSSLYFALSASLLLSLYPVIGLISKTKE
jgi:hypothetical protein